MMIKLFRGDKVIIQRRKLDVEEVMVWTEIQTFEVISDWAELEFKEDGIDTVKGCLSCSGCYVFEEGVPCPLCCKGTIKYINYTEEKYRKNYDMEDNGE